VDNADKKIVITQGLLLGGMGILALYVGLVLRSKLPPQIPLLYSRPWGEEQLVEPKFLTIPFALILGCGIIFGVAKKFVNENVLKKLIFGGLIAVEILLLLAITRIILLIN
jgi:hypothetical protein